MHAEIGRSDVVRNAVLLGLLGGLALLQQPGRAQETVPREFQGMAEVTSYRGVVYPFDTEEYFRQHFPKSTKLLFPGG